MPFNEEIKSSIQVYQRIDNELSLTNNLFHVIKANTKQINGKLVTIH
jgi:hypothetical protein